MLNKEDFLKFNWIGAEAKRRVSSSEVSITPRQHGYGFIFRIEDFPKRLGGKHIEYALVDDNTIAFRCGTNGYTLSKKDNCPNYSFLANTDKDAGLHKKLEKFVGDYELKYDKTFNLYYIQKM